MNLPAGIVVIPPLAHVLSDSAIRTGDAANTLLFSRVQRLLGLRDYDSTLRSDIRRFQASAHLRMTGVWDSDTAAVLYEQLGLIGRSDVGALLARDFDSTGVLQTDAGLDPRLLRSAVEAHGREIHESLGEFVAKLRYLHS